MIPLRFHTPGWRVSVALVTAAISGAGFPVSRGLDAQDISYTSLTSMEFGGAMGMMMRMVPDAGKASRQTTLIKGSLMRTDDEKSSTIMDMAEGRYTVLDHEAKSYFTMTLADMQAQMAEAQARMAEENPMAAQGAPMEEGAFDLKFSTDRTGRTRNFDGYSAEQVLMTMEMVPTSPEAMEAAAVTGRTVMFTELWISSDFPEAQAYREAQQKLGEAFAEGGGAGMMGAMSQALAASPGMQEAFQKNWEEMKDMEGVPVRTVTHMVSVPAGVEFDPNAVLAAADKPLETVDMPSASDVAKDAARGAMGRRLGGLMGRRQQEAQPEAPAGPATQTITMRAVSTIEEIKTGPLSGDLFQTPPDYKERRPDWARGG